MKKILVMLMLLFVLACQQQSGTPPDKAKEEGTPPPMEEKQGEVPKPAEKDAP